MERTNGNKDGTTINGHRYGFDSFEVDPGNRILVRHGDVVPLTGKVFDILLVFVQNPGRLLGKDELLDKVWHEEFVEEGNLARNVSTLRKALGDTGKEHKYIATVQGHGYRFIADVISEEQIADRPDDKILETGNTGFIDPALNSNSDRGREELPHEKAGIVTQLVHRPWLLSISALCLIVGAVVAFRLEGYKPPQIETFSFDRIRRTRLTQEGNVVGGMISPDGQYLAYQRIVGHEKALSLRQISTGSVLDLRPQSGSTYWAVAFAPDNSFLYYIERTQDSDFGDIYRIPLLGGQPHKMIGYADGGLTISPDGRKLAFVRIDRQKGTSAIVVADNDGANEQTISSRDLDSMFYSLDWAPDGKSFIYSFKRHEENHEYWYLAEIPADGGEERRIGDTSDSTVFMARWLPDKSGLIVNAIDEATRVPQIYSVSYPDGAKRRITNDLNSYIGFSMTADAHSIVLPEINSNREIWDLTDGDTDGPRQVSNGREKHFDSVAWAADQYLLFDEDENSSFNNFNIYRTHPDGTAAEQLTFGSGNNMDPAVSPDGHTVAFVSSRSGTRQLWRMNIDGHDVVRLTDLPYNVIHPVFSGDGQRVYFSLMIAGQCKVWQVSVNGGEPSMVVDGDIYRWAVSRDGKDLAYSSYDKQAKAIRTHIHSLQGDKPDTVFDISPETWMEWSSDGKAVYFNTAEDDARNVWRQPVDGSKPLPMTSFSSEQIFRFAWSANGKNLACIRHTTTFDTLMLHVD